MSSHFNYEIDERNLRVKLKDMSLPYKEEAWTQFENYADEHRLSAKRAALPSFNLNINRTLILPFVFGGVIIGFSLLLFNFISIKNKPETEALASNKMQQEPVKEEKIVPVTEVKVDTAKVVPTSTVAEIKIDTVKPEPAIVANTVALTPPTPTVAAVVNPAAGTWSTVETLQVYESPNIASKVIGSAGVNKTFTALEETNYFIKISLDNGAKTGYVRKHLMLKNNGQNPNRTSVRQKPKKAEVLETIQAPVKLSEENEPELR
jgi:hypothetical protein